MYQKNLSSFLKLGYFLDFKNNDINIDLSNIDKHKYQSVDLELLIKTGCKIWAEAISFNFDSNQKHLVPISGGLDSRAILAGLLKHTEAKNIYTYTFGTPSTLDYEIGNYIARQLGTQHTSFDLTQCSYNQKELEDISKRVGFQTVLFHHAPVWEVDKKFQGCQTWSGFMGDPLAGNKLSHSPSISLEIAKKNFIKKNRYVSSIDLTNGVTCQDLIECDSVESNILTIDEQLDFQNRQTKYIAPHVLMKGYAFKMPFLYQPWVEFMLSVPNSLRIDQQLYKKILLQSFPIEFGYKTKTNFGLPLSANSNQVFSKRFIDKFMRITKLSAGGNINYLDFDKKIREKVDLEKVVKTNLVDLRERGIVSWIDIDSIMRDHFVKRKNRSDALIVLASLEIHLKAGLKL